MEDVVGYFVNTVALRIKVGANGLAPSLSELVHSAHDTVLDALEHADCPLSCVVDALKVPRDPTRSPIFQVRPRDPLFERAGNGLRIQKFDLVVMIVR